MGHSHRNARAFTPLSSGGLGDLSCSSVVGAYAGCVTSTGRPALVPVDGTRAPTVGPPGAGAYLAVAGTTDHVAYTAGRSPVTASDFSLSPGRVVHDDDRQVGASYASSTFSTAVATDASQPVVGATGAVHKGTAPLTALGSGTSTVYSLPAASSDHQTRVVRTPHGSTSLTTLAGDLYFGPGNLSGSLSGNRFVYAVDRPGGHVLVYLFDASTGHSTLVQRELNGALPVVFGDHLAFVRSDGSVWRRNLITGALTQLSPPLPLQVNFGQLFAWGDYVGWNLYAGDDDEGAGPSTEVHAYRNARTLASARSFGTPIHALSSAGVVLSAGSLDFSPLNPDAYSLETYGGATIPLLTRTSYVAGPQVEGGTVAWIDGTGVLKVAPVAVAPAAPRFLGAPLAPAGIANTGRVGWRAYAPYSAPLTGCSVEITGGTRVVRRIACDPTRMSVGVADFGWDGTYGGHRARAGLYRYRVLARGAGGAALDAGGDGSPVTHTIAVGRPTRTALYVAPTVVRAGSTAVLRAALTTTGGSRHGARPVSRTVTVRVR